MSAQKAMLAVGSPDPPEGETRMPREKRPDDLVGVRLDISDDVRKRLVVAAAKRDLSMAACLRKVVTDWVDKVEPPVTSDPTPKPRKRKEKPE